MISPLNVPAVFGENVAQALHFVRAGAAEAGLVALALVAHGDAPYWEVPPEWHEPIRQQAVLLQSAADNQAARQFHVFLQSAEAGEILAAYGYALPPG